MNIEITNLLLKKYGKKNPAQINSGDTVKVHLRIKEGDKERVQIFEGLVIATKHGAGLDGSFTVRKIASGSIGVERVFPLHSPNIVKVERIKTAEVNRSKIYFMRGRKGKSARFKHEEANPGMWDESSVVEEVLPATDEVVVEAGLEDVEGVTEADADENIATLEEVEESMEGVELVEEDTEAVAEEVEEKKEAKK